MASAAAVAADQAITPPDDNLGEDFGVPGEVTSAVGAEPMNGDGDEEGGDDDLFGDEEDEDDVLPEPTARPKKTLDDEDLDSGDDIDRDDRAPEDQEEAQQYEERSFTVADFTLPRQSFPQPSDGEMYLMKVPKFLEINEKGFQHTEFQPPTTDHHSKTEPSATFSAYNTAMTTIRWRRSPSDRSQLQSNARILRWSDGSFTLQLASDPTMQYEIEGNALAPPQRNPAKPTPTSVQSKGASKYDASKDSFTYLIAPYTDSASLLVTNKVTTGLSVKQSDTSADEAVQRLQVALAKATNANKTNGAGDMQLELVEEDPESARKKAEEAMRLKAKADRKREAAIQREADRSQRALGSKGLSSGRYGGGLSAGMLEDDEAIGEGYGRQKPRSKPRRRRGSEYSTDEDLGHNRFSKQDEYDQEDDFLAPSDEEEIVEDDDDPDDGIVEQARERTPKRSRAADPVDEDEDADGEVDEDVPQTRVKRRRVIDDDDDDDE